MTDPTTAAIALYAELFEQRPELRPVYESELVLHRWRGESWAWVYEADNGNRVWTGAVRDSDALAHCRSNLAMRVAEAGISLSRCRGCCGNIHMSRNDGCVIGAEPTYDEALISAAGPLSVYRRTTSLDTLHPVDSGMSPDV